MPNISAGSVLETSVKPSKASQLEDGVVVLLVELVAPVPGTRESAVYTRASIIEIISTRSIKSMFEEVLQNV